MEELALQEQKKPRKQRTPRHVEIYVMGCSEWGWFKTGSNKPRLYALKQVEGFNKLVVIDTRKKASQAEFVLLASADPIDLVAELTKTGHELIGKIQHPRPPKKKKKS